FDLEQQLGYLVELRRDLAEFRPPERAMGDPDRYFLENGSYGRVDADVLYAIVRAAKPKRIIELGSGYTTLVAAQACLENEREGAAVEYVAFDPYPGVARPDLPGLTELARPPAEELAPARSGELGPRNT